MSTELVIVAYLAIGIACAVCVYHWLETWAGTWEDYAIVLLAVLLWLPLLVCVFGVALLGWLFERRDLRVLR